MPDTTSYLGKTISKDWLRWHLAQLHAQIEVLSLIQPRKPLPRFTRRTIAPDLALKLAELTVERNPQNVIELGPGISTLVLAYTLSRFGEGRIVSFEHDEEYADYMRNAISEHSLTRNAEIITAPLKQLVFGQRKCLWYDTSVMDHMSPKSVDMVFIDGPPARLGEMMRYPSLPALYDKLGPNAILVLDDAKRKSERSILSEWSKEFADIKINLFGLEKGMAIITKP